MYNFLSAISSIEANAKPNEPNILYSVVKETNICPYEYPFCLLVEFWGFVGNYTYIMLLCIFVIMLDQCTNDMGTDKNRSAWNLTMIETLFNDMTVVVVHRPKVS
ncbi:hypothetical protein BDF21DRAFT_400894 [Thamnidium elegans]|nr:hypothetical protein BDF21DRAFT_400894 [Thamnidium elegans]